MMVTPLDLLAVLALLAVIMGMGAVTFRTLALLFRDMTQIKVEWKARAMVLVAWAIAYLVLVGMDVPGVILTLTTDGNNEFDTVAKTTLLAGWLWTLFSILPMLAKGRLP